MTPALTSQVFGQLDADFRTSTSPHSILSPSSCCDMDCAGTGQAAHKAGTALLLPPPVLQEHPSARSHHTNSLSATWALKPRKQISCALCLEMLEMFRKVGQDHGFVAPSPTGQAGSFQALHRVSNETDAAQHLQPLTLGLIHHPAETEKPGSSFI